MTTYLYLDLETAPDPEREYLWPLALPPTAEHDPDLFGCTAKDAEAKIREMDVPTLHLAKASELNSAKPRKTVLDAIDKWIKTRDEAESQHVKTLSLTPEAGRIVAVGYATDGDDVASLVCTSTGQEREALEYVWQMLRMRGTVLVGFNVAKFDLAYLYVRSILLGVKPSRTLDRRPWGSDVVDLMEARFPREKAMGLKRLAELYGIEPECPDVDGSDVHRLVAEGDWLTLAAYVQSDVIVTRELHRLFRGAFC